MSVIISDRLEDFVVECVRGIGRFVPFHVLNAAIEKHLGFDTRGDAHIVSPDNPNHVVWPSLDPAVADAISSAVAKKRIYMIPALAKQYANTGVDLREDGFDVIDYDNPPPVKTSKPIWLPMTLSSQSLAVKPPPFMSPEAVAMYK